MICHVEKLESRQLLTNLVAVSVSGGAVSLTDASTHRVTSGDSFSVSYTSSQVVLTGQNGTSFVVGGETMSTYTASVTGTLSLTMALNAKSNSVSVAGDGTTDLSSLMIDLSNSRQDNLVSLTKVVADSVTIYGGRRNDSVSVSQSTVNDNLTADLGRVANDFLSLATTTVKGNVDDQVSQLVTNQSTITGTLSNTELRRNSTFNSTDTTYTGATTIQMGRNGVINMLGSVTGQNHFESSESVTGKRRRPTVINEVQNSVVNDVTPTLTYASVRSSTTTVAAPTVVSQTVPTSTTPVITGTYDSVNAPNLAVTVGGTTYKLGTDSQLTSPSTGKWSLNLGSETLSSALTVTVTNADNHGNSASATGTIATDQQAISAYVTKNNLTATTTADGLNYVITTNGTGAVPTSGQTVNAKYAGFILNADGTLGTEFDSNTTTGISFTLGVGDVIAGWDEAFALLPVGTVAKLLIPSALAYGTTGHGTTIPANAVLEFDVTVVSAT